MITFFSLFSSSSFKKVKCLITSYDFFTDRKKKSCIIFQFIVHIWENLYIRVKKSFAPINEKNFSIIVRKKIVIHIFQYKIFNIFFI